MKLWQKERSEGSDAVNEFTAGTDRHWDLLLAKYDVLGSIAHTEMLAKIGLLGAGEKVLIHAELRTILADIGNGTFEIEDGVEDIHSQVELLLTRNIGDIGKKIHSGRSRNDQVLLDVKLFLREELKEVGMRTEEFFNVLITLSESHKEKLLPGYTHLQLAMPSSFGLWFGAYAESLADDVELLLAARKVINRNPLGSGAGYGSSFPLDRQMTTDLLEFEGMNYNVVYAQMTRGKSERIAAAALANIAATLSKLAYDICLYMNQNFGFVSFPEELCTGSSIMPHKRNPDVFELVRAKCNRIQAVPNELALLCNNLPSGYHRDMQLTKEILFPAISELKNCLEMMSGMLKRIQVKDRLLSDEKYQVLFTVELVNQLVLEGVPFREAYHQVAEQVKKGEFCFSGAPVHVHEGSMGRLCNDKISERMRKLMSGMRS